MTAYTNTSKATVISADATMTAYTNTGPPPVVIPTFSTMMSYINTGSTIGGPLKVVRQQHGWGVIPTGSQTITVLYDASAGTAEAYENSV
jgi:hypothetical protein